MPSVQTVHEIQASPGVVFRALAEPEGVTAFQPEIVSVDFLSSQRSGRGTRFRETRKVGGRTASTVLEIVEHEPEKRVRYVSEAMGAAWDTLFSLEPGPGGGTRVTTTIEATPKRLGARVLVALMMPMVKKAIGADLERVKTWCEAAGSRSGGPGA